MQQISFPAPDSMPGPQVFEPTGIPQLDLVLGGGLARSKLVVLFGPPGSGKTTLAGQIGFAAAKRGQKVLILTTFSESTMKLLQHLQYFRFYDPNLIGSSVQVFSLQQFLAQGVSTLYQEIAATVSQVQANLVILDGFQGIRDIYRDIAATRQLIYNLGMRLSLQGTTMLITTEADPRDPEHFPEMTAADALIGLYSKLEGVRTFRSLEVLKVRGRAPLVGRHSLHMDEWGIQIFPRLEARTHSLTFEGWPASSTHTALSERATFGLPRLDSLLGGGLTRQTATLLVGSYGTGKTLLALQFALAGVSQGEAVLFLGFRETGEQLMQKADAFGMGTHLRAALATDKANGKLLLQRWEPVELDPDQVATHLLIALEQTDVRRVVIDSIAELERAVEESSGKARVPDYLAALLAALRAHGVTLLAVKEMPRLLPTQVDFSTDVVAVLAENVLLTRQAIHQGHLYRLFSVLKMRFSAYDYAVHEMVLAPAQGIQFPAADQSRQAMLERLALQQVKVDEDIEHLSCSLEGNPGASKP